MSSWLSYLTGSSSSTSTQSNQAPYISDNLQQSAPTQDRASKEQSIQEAEKVLFKILDDFGFTVILGNSPAAQFANATLVNSLKELLKDLIPYLLNDAFAGLAHEHIVIPQLFQRFNLFFSAYTDAMKDLVNQDIRIEECAEENKEEILEKILTAFRSHRSKKGLSAPFKTEEESIPFLYQPILFLLRGAHELYFPPTLGKESSEVLLHTLSGMLLIVADKILQPHIFCEIATRYLDEYKADPKADPYRSTKESKEKSQNSEKFRQDMSLQLQVFFSNTLSVAKMRGPMLPIKTLLRELNPMISDSIAQMAHERLARKSSAPSIGPLRYARVLLYKKEGATSSPHPLYRAASIKNYDKVLAVKTFISNNSTKLKNLLFDFLDKNIATYLCSSAIVDKCNSLIERLEPILVHPVLWRYLVYDLLYGMQLALTTVAVSHLEDANDETGFTKIDCSQEICNQNIKYLQEGFTAKLSNLVGSMLATKPVLPDIQLTILEKSFFNKWCTPKEPSHFKINQEANPELYDNICFVSELFMRIAKHYSFSSYTKLGSRYQAISDTILNALKHNIMGFIPQLIMKEGRKLCSSEKILLKHLLIGLNSFFKDYASVKDAKKLAENEVFKAISVIRMHQSKGQYPISTPDDLDKELFKVLENIFTRVCSQLFQHEFQDTHIVSLKIGIQILCALTLTGLDKLVSKDMIGITLLRLFTEDIKWKGAEYKLDPKETKETDKQYSTIITAYVKTLIHHFVDIGIDQYIYRKGTKLAVSAYDEEIAAYLLAFCNEALLSPFNMRPFLILNMILFQQTTDKEWVPPQFKAPPSIESLQKLLHNFITKYNTELPSQNDRLFEIGCKFLSLLHQKSLVKLLLYDVLTRVAYGLAEIEKAQAEAIKKS